VDVTPTYLTGLFDEHTSIQAAKLVEAFIGKWIRVSGPIGDVAPLDDKRAVVWLVHIVGEPLMPCYFNGRGVVDELRVLRKGDPVTILGQVARVSGPASLDLNNCELERSKGQSE